MDNPQQNQQQHEEDIVDPAQYLAGDSVLLQQLPTVEESEEMMTCFYFPRSPASFSLCPPMPNVLFVSSPWDINLALSYQQILEDKSGAFHVIKGVECKDFLLYSGFESYITHGVAKAASLMPKDMTSLWDNKTLDHAHVFDKADLTIRCINGLEQHDEDIIDKPIYEQVGVVQQLIQNRDGELDVIYGGGAFTINGHECRQSPGLPTTPETLHNCQAKYFIRVWLGHGGQWVAEIRLRCNHLNIGSFTNVEDAISAYEGIWRWSGQVDPARFPGLFENENLSKLPLQLPSSAQK